MRVLTHCLPCWYGLLPLSTDEVGLDKQVFQTIFNENRPRMAAFTSYVRRNPFWLARRHLSVSVLALVKQGSNVSLRRTLLSEKFAVF